MRRTALLLSGGIDSIALAYMCRPQIAVTVDYGQLPFAGELRAATAVAEALEMEHEVLHVDVSELGSGEMIGRDPLDLAPVREWWPFRNQMLVTVAAMRLVALEVERILIGTVGTDGAHGDGRTDFIRAMDCALRVQEGGMRLEAPAIELTAEELVRRSGVPWELLAWSHSCHVAPFACGSCRGCQKSYRTCEAFDGLAY